jgi:hypothetical protein
MIRLALAATAAAALLLSGLGLSGQATAQDGTYAAMPFGEKGARAGTQCWIDTSGGWYWGYWAPCPAAKGAPKAAKTAKR